MPDIMMQKTPVRKPKNSAQGSRTGEKQVLSGTMMEVQTGRIKLVLWDLLGSGEPSFQKQSYS